MEDEVVVTNVQTIHRLIQEQIDISGDESLRPLLTIHDLATLKANLAPGSTTQAVAVCTFAYFTANAAVMTTPVIAAMPKLSTALKNVLVGMPALTATLAMPSFGRRVDLTGGQREIVLLRVASTLGPAGYAVLFAFTDVASIDSFNLPFAAMVACNALAGLSLATFPMANTLRYWARQKDVGFALSILGGISNTAAPLALFAYQGALSAELPPQYIYIISTAISAIGGLAVYYGYPASPFHALIKRGFPDEAARTIAKAFGEEIFPVAANAPFWPAIWTTAKDFRATMFSMMGVAASGGNYAFNLSLPFTLKNLMPDLTSQQTVIYTACMSLSATIFRVVSGKLMDKFDSSRGVYSFLGSAALMITGSSMLLFNRPLPSLTYTLIGATIMAHGFGSGAASVFKNIAAASNEGKHLKPYDAGKMTVIVSTIGQSTGTWGPWYFALIAYLNEGKAKENNLDTFYLSFALTIAGTLLLLMNEYRKRAPISICTSWAGRHQPKPDGNTIELDESPKTKLIASNMR